MLQDIIRRVTMNASTQFKALGYMTTNLANYNTTGYKKKEFLTYLDEAGNVKATVRGDDANGQLLRSKNPLDFAIDGPGYFPVTKPDGTNAYTRDGRFIVNAKGYLATLTGGMVGDGIKIPVNYYKLKVDQDGSVKIRVKEQDDYKTIGKINIVSFACPGEVKDIGENLVTPTAASGEAKPYKEGCIKQYFTETSNLNIWDSVSETLRINGSYIAGLRLVKYVDEVYRQSVNLRQ